MAANNYFGFTHGGTQYSPQPATAYQAAQTAYVQPAHQTAYATAAAPRAAQAYETYPATHTTGQYAYAATRPQVPVSIAAAATYDASKTYYAPTAAAPAAAATAVYSVAESQYQAGIHKTAAKTPYNTSYATQVQPRPTAAVKTPVAAQSSANYTVYPSSTSSASTTAGASFSAATTSASFSGYDAALYSAATSYYQQQQASKTGTTWQYKKGVPGTTAKPKTKVPPKPPQLHYCEVCKISCAGPQTYREHLEGQKHKKKEAAAKQGASAGANSAARAQNQLRCELCDVSCTGSDAYAAHIRGAKHEKVVKLHTKLGKPIPSTDPVVVPAVPDKPAASSASASMKNPVAGSAKKLVSTPKITFVGEGGGAKLTMGGGVKTEEKAESKVDDDDDKILDKDVVPVGQEYIEEMKNEAGKIVSFNCKLCECKFNDPNAKEMHMKGRKHRLQYKKKVDPSLQVEVKPSIRARKLQEEKMRRQAAKEDFWRRQEDAWRHEMRYMMAEEEYYYMNRFGRMPPFMGPMRRPETTDDRHVMAKHTSIYPNEAELQAVQNIVSTCEKALKHVSDIVAESDGPKPMETVAVKEEPAEGDAESKSDAPARAIKGVMRVGVLAKGLLLHGDLNVQLVLLCSEKPTRTLLVRVADSLPKQILAVAEPDCKYDVKMCVEEAAVIVTSDAEPRAVCKVTLTSPIMREDSKAEAAESPAVRDPPDVLDRHKCLAALAALRHAKWFQARANGLQSCVIIIRILRDLCQRVPTWTPLNQWAMELLVEKCVSSGGPNMSPGDALRRVFECISSGILLPGGPGLYDPCEKEARDCAIDLSAQEREDITASAQHALRLIAFRQVHKVLGMDPLPAPRFQRRPGFNPRKRRHTNSASDGEGADGKKDKKDEIEGK